MTAWILVSDASRARLFSAELREDDWSLVSEFEHPESRERSSDIATSQRGRTQQSPSAGTQRAAMDPQTTPKQAEVDRFAQQLSDYLEKAIAKRQYDYLVLVAPPNFLGTLHGTLGQQSAKHVRTTVNKDLCQFDAAEIRKRLVDAVFPDKAASD